MDEFIRAVLSNLRTSRNQFIFLLALSCSLTVEAGSGSIDSGSGDMEFEVNFRYPPTTTQIDDAKKALSTMSQMICDAADGQVQVSEVRLTGGQVEEDKAAFWYYPDNFRSGGSIYGDGSGLTRLGSHLSLSARAQFQPDVLAHELAHHAFGLGEQYEEQRRSGDCGIGRGFESAALDERNHSLMQQSGGPRCVGGSNDGAYCRWNSECGSAVCRPQLMSEFSVASNHDALRGDTPFPPSGTCSKPFYEGGWNAGTAKWESTHQTLWHGKSDWEKLVENYPFVTAPAGLPIEAPSSNCMVAPTYVEDVVGHDQILLIMDRSLSMAWSSRDSVIEVCDNLIDDDSDGDTDESDCAESRMNFVQGAAQAFIDLQKNAGIDLGLLEFNHSNRPVRPIGLLDSSNSEDYKIDVRNLMPSGNTAIGDALEASKAQFAAAASAGRSQTAFLLTDGFSNRGADPATKVQDLKDLDIRVFTIPAGSAADVDGLSSIAAQTGAYMIKANPIDELPAVYAELAAQYNGSGLIVPRTPFILYGNGKGTDDQPPRGKNQENLAAATEEKFFELPVEKGADSLVSFISGRNSHMDTWDLEVELYSPDGAVYTNASPELTINSYYIFFRVPNPTPGMWKLRVLAGNGFVQESTALAFVDNAEPKLLADVRPRLVKSTDHVTVSATPIYAAEIEDGISIEGIVTRPDGSEKPIVLEREPFGGSWSTDFQDYVGRGNYEITLNLAADATAKTKLGETIFDGPERFPVDVVPFVRSKTLTFTVADGKFPECRTDDCDNDGIVNKLECGKDTDRDGIPNIWDTDSDNDDIPDSVEGLDDRNDNGLPDACDKEGSKFDEIIADIDLSANDEIRGFELVCRDDYIQASELLKQSLTRIETLLKQINESSIEVSDSAIEYIEGLYDHQNRVFDLLSQKGIRCEDSEEFIEEMKSIIGKLRQELK